MLHPQISEIMNYVSTVFGRTKLITNLITQDSEKLLELNRIKNMSWLINTTTAEKNKEIFTRNIKLLAKQELSYDYIKKFCLSLVLTGSFDEDAYFIDNLINIIQFFPKNFPVKVRITPNMPDNSTENKYNFCNYDKQYIYFSEKIEKLGIKIISGTDCGLQYCFVSPDVLKRFAEICNFRDIKLGCHHAPFIDITTDLKVHFCHYCAEEDFPAMPYNRFESPDDYYKYMFEIKEKITRNEHFLCKKRINSHNCSGCSGFCTALNRKLKIMYGPENLNIYTV